MERALKKFLGLSRGLWRLMEKTWDFACNHCKTRVHKLRIDQSQQPLKMAGIEDPQSAKAEAKRMECPEDEIYSFVTFGSKWEILTNTKIKVCGIASKDKIDQFVFAMKNRETDIKTFFVVTKSDLGVSLEIFGSGTGRVFCSLYFGSGQVWVG